MIRSILSRLRYVGFAVCIVCATAAVVPSANAQSAEATKVSILFPAYGNPYNQDGKAMWSKLVELSRERRAGLEIDVVFNPASGPGKRRDPNYLNDEGNGPLADVQGLRILGYVPTSYAKRSSDDIKRDIDVYATGFYAGYVSGIFFDETSSDLSTAEYYREMSQYAHRAIKPSAGHTVTTVSNPGIGEVQPPVTAERLQAYATAMDMVLVFEHDAKSYRDVKPAAVAAYLSPGQLIHVVHSQPAWNPDLVTAMRQHGVANLFITDDVMPNPYDKLPAYFDKLCEAVVAVNQSR